ncbi:MAG TPA: protease HtpX [Steroidobacteraceae bacterium]|jgi:heat shock protein HtpX|nr:protease HtpX [Steroidobacteraceae bacterium]
MKRIVLFLLTNLAILAMLTLLVRVTGVDAWLAARGMSLASLLVMATIFGFAGSLLSLAMSKWMAIRSLGVQRIEQPGSPSEQWLLETIQGLAQRAGVGRPEVGIFPEARPNAFATGASRDHALVAVSSGLLAAMSRDEMEAVLGHELSHVANGDMVTLALLQGVLNTFVVLLSWLVGNIVDRSITRDSEGRGLGYMATVWITQLVLGLLATMVVMWFSRRREFRADAGGARLAGREHMVAALERLRRATCEPLPAHMHAFGITGGQGGWLARLFLSHPPLEERIAALSAPA